MPILEDKIVQGAVAETLSAVYEADFLAVTVPRGGAPVWIALVGFERVGTSDTLPRRDRSGEAFA